MSSVKKTIEETKKVLATIPPQGKRQGSIEISLSFAQPDTERDYEIDTLILKTIFGIH